MKSFILLVLVALVGCGSKADKPQVERKATQPSNDFIVGDINTGETKKYDGPMTLEELNKQKPTPVENGYGQQIPHKKDVHVNGYTRKDGTYVAPYNRSAPRK